VPNRESPLTSVTRLYLVRHGATQRTAEDRFSGAEGVHLSEEGKSQASLLGERLDSEQPRAIYSSPLSRAVETANVIAKRCALKLETRDGLREIAHGHWEGLTRTEVEERYPDEYASWEADPFTFAPKQGESGVAVLARALPVIREIVTRHEGERVLVVSHKVLDFRGPVRARLMLFNDTSHYSRHPRASGQNLSNW
jgi:broad specificity phosphatase PhoE